MTESQTVTRFEFNQRRRKLDTLNNFGKGCVGGLLNLVQDGVPLEIAAGHIREAFYDFAKRYGLRPGTLDSNLALTAFERRLSEVSGLPAADPSVNGEIP